MENVVLARETTDHAPMPQAAPQRIADDMAMLRAAADLTRDLNAPDPRVYWGDFLGSTLLGYAALAGAIGFANPLLAIALGVLAVLALYRAGAFIHEVSHIKHSALPGFRLVWNALIGVPMLAPSFMYEGVHNLHHARTRYGTADDPEYLPLALMRPWTLPVFLAASLFAPLALLIRFGVLAPLSLLSPRLRRVVVARYSSLSINPGFERRAPEGEARAVWHALEAAASLWAIALIALVASGVVPLRAFAIIAVVVALVAVINQMRTLVAHLWENEGEPITVTAQYLDSVNVPPPGVLPLLWAPVGLRYHALHHLLPSLPYHALAEAHRRLAAALDAGSPYHRANYRGPTGLVMRIARSTMTRRT